MFDWTKPTVQLLGRYQPWHPGHRALFVRALEKTGQVVIMLREIKDEKNPFSFEERKGFIVEDLEGQGYKNEGDFVVLAVPNIVNITYGRDVGYAIEQEKLDEATESISATKIRAERLKPSS